jgi:signal transduction histidine kinase
LSALAPGHDVIHTDALREQLDSLHAISVEIAALRNLQEVYDRTLAYCLQLTGSEMGAIDLLTDDGNEMELVALRGFEPSDPSFLERHRTTPVRPSLFGLVVIEGRSRISNDVEHDPDRVGTPFGHPVLRTYLGVPLQVGSTVIGMIAVANRPGGYDSHDERLLATFANQVAVAIENARLNERQQEMIAGLESFNQRLHEAERQRLLARERDRIAGELHDDIQQGVFAIGLRLGSLLDHELDPSVANELREVRELAGRTAQEVRKAIFAVAEGGDERADLTSSVRALLSAVGEASGLETDLAVAGSPVPAVSRVQGVLSSVIKETLTNVVRHANASLVLVSMRYGDDSVEVVVQDDGVGIGDLVLRRYAQDSLHFGLRHMKQQVLELGGTFEVTNGDEVGVTVKVSVPLVRAAEESADTRVGPHPQLAITRSGAERAPNATRTRVKDFTRSQDADAADTGNT